MNENAGHRRAGDATQRPSGDGSACPRPGSKAPARVAVIGGGWAGLAAAIHLHDAGCCVTVFEAARTPGGRARRVERHDAGRAALPLDNGQHILLGAYHETLALMRRLGRDPEHLLLRMRLRLEAADGRFRLAMPACTARLPAPLPALAALLSARGLTLRERWAACTLMRALRATGWSAPPDWSVAQLLAHHRQPARLQAQLWQPLCLAALNTPAESASAVLFVSVLRDGLARGAQESSLLLARSDLSALWPEAATAQIDWRSGQRVRAIELASALATELATAPADPLVRQRAHQAAPLYRVANKPFDAVILATPPEAAAALLAALPAWPGAPELLAALNAFTHLPIATVTLRLAEPWRAPAPMLMLNPNPALDHYGQWLFDRAALLGHTDAGELAVVISAAHDLPARSILAQHIEAQVRAQLGARARARRHARLPAVTAHSVITEKRATFAATPGLARPAAQTPWPGLLLAGDWTDTGYPGVLEGAVRSGVAAAHALLAVSSD